MYNIYLDILGKTDFSEFQTQGVTIHVTGSFPQKTSQFEFDYFLLTMITLQSVTDTARQTFDCFFLGTDMTKPIVALSCFPAKNPLTFSPPVDGHFYV